MALPGAVYLWGEKQAAGIGIICIMGLLGLMLMRVGLRKQAADLGIIGIMGLMGLG